jgi:hypothetical protein
MSRSANAPSLTDTLAQSLVQNAELGRVSPTLQGGLVIVKRPGLFFQPD